MKFIRTGVFLMIFGSLPATGCHKAPQEIERPERIHSKREVVYDSATCAKLAGLWEKYYNAYPSEDAYANWMYAAFYADFSIVSSMVDKGLGMYPANPTLLYLAA